MIRAVLRKELTECRRDGRARILAGLIAALILVSLLTGWTAQTDQRRRASAAQTDDESTFRRQGEKSPHAAAHFGRMAYVPTPPLAVFDPGVAPYLGQVIWLEAHTRSPAIFRPAEDAPELRRLADLSPAGILALLVPLLLIVLGHGAFAAERERGTLRQVLSAGASPARLFAGKLAALAGIGITASLIAIAVSTTLALAAGDRSATDILARSTGLALGYTCYAIACAAAALFVSARSRTATSALLILLALWAACIVILPRAAATVAARAHPTPPSGRFWTDAAEAIRTRRPAKDSEERRAIERRVLSRALGRDVSPEEAARLDISRPGLNMEVAEVLDAEAYADAYRALDETQDDQKRLRRLFAALSPVVALQHLSSALAGTDLAAHRDFARAAEAQRGEILRTLNEDMMLRGARRGIDYQADTDLWAKVPDVTYHPPPASAALAEAAADLLTLAAWALLAVYLAARAARRQPALGEPS